MSGKVVAGASLSVVSSIMANFGVNLQKKVVVRNLALPEKDQISVYRSCKWWLGLGGVIFGAIGDFAALGLAPQSLCTALGGATCLLANLFIAKFWLKEELVKTDVVGVVLIIAGAVTIATQSPPGKDYELPELIDNLQVQRYRRNIHYLPRNPHSFVSTCCPFSPL